MRGRAFNPWKQDGLVICRGGGEAECSWETEAEGVTATREGGTTVVEVRYDGYMPVVVGLRAVE